MKIDGRAISSEILSKLKEKVAKLKAKGINPVLAIILMGDNQASAIYVRQKGIKAKEIGAEVKVFPLKENETNQETEKLVKKLDSDSKIHGIIIQRPAPKNVDANSLTELISPEKEVDGFGSSSKYPVPVAEAVLLMLRGVYEKTKTNGPFSDWLKFKKIVVIGKGETAGRPITELLREYELAPTVIDSHTKNKEELIKKADIVISAVGKKVLTSSNIKKGVILIGVGLYSDSQGKLRGDYDDEDVAGKVSFYSPTPGGVGPVNVACLMQNLVKAAQKSS